jgi:hypothetical protein
MKAGQKTPSLTGREDKQEKAVYLSNSWVNPEVEVEEFPAA